MKWTRSETVGLSNPRCRNCHGLGLTFHRSGLLPCTCVLRAIFRSCHRRFRLAVMRGLTCTRTSLEFTGGCDHRFSWGRKEEEFAADFLLISRRVLDDDEYRIFSAHYLLGADWRLCCRQLGFQRGDFFHEAYRIEAKLGRIYRELQPYGLYPLTDYFYSSSREMEGRNRPFPGYQAVRILRPDQRFPIPGNQAA
jgi:hypothetical protein